MNQGALFPPWHECIISLLPLSKYETPQPATVPPVPRRIESFSRDLSLDLVASIVADKNVAPWIEKTRRYIEINRPRLKEVSRSRFGTRKEADSTLRSMGYVLAINAYHNNCLLSFNALGSLVDAVPSVRQPSSDEMVKVMESTLSLASRFVDMRHDR